MNNVVVAQTVVALAEALAVARASGAADPEVLFSTLTKGSADSYAIAPAESAGLTLEQATTTRRLMERTAAAGYGEQYCTSVIRAIEKR